jgi:hypothetical protein
LKLKRKPRLRQNKKLLSRRPPLKKLLLRKPLPRKKLLRQKLKLRLKPRLKN